MMSTRSVELPRTQAVSERGFLGVSALLFVASTVATVAWCTSMAGVGQMPMPGGWTVSMMWMPMCGQTWLGTAASFLGMWVVMMVAMMLPSLVPMLRGYRHSVRATGAVRLDVLTTLVGLGYFAVWAAFGVVVFAFGAGHPRADGNRCPRGWCAPVLRMESASACVLPRGGRVQSCIAHRC
jgi:predicted metal-binding membrane protein